MLGARVEVELGIGLGLDELGSAACAMGMSLGCHMDSSICS